MISNLFISKKELKEKIEQQQKDIENLKHSHKELMERYNGLMKNYKPYGHQIGMLDKAFAGRGEDGQVLKYKNTVITSGTGSGKTESFLLPLLADIFKESKK